VKLLGEELKKPVCDRDAPRVARLFRQCFTVRRNAIAAIPDGNVGDIVKSWPLLETAEYVSSSCHYAYGVHVTLL